MKVSFCTTCMGRLYHLEQTILRNIEAVADYDECEFILLDYNSKDGLKEWVAENLDVHMKTGRVKYYRTDEPSYYISSHAKNLAHKMASGDILCNIDSDITIPNGFCDFIKGVFLENENSIISFDSKDRQGNNGCAGIIAAKREHFYSVNGYDEKIYLGWGYDDMNYQFRCRMHNNLRLVTPEPICSCIDHSNEVRSENFQLKDIVASRDISYAICLAAAEDKDYVANKDEEWGKAVLFKNFSDIPLEA